VSESVIKRIEKNDRLSRVVVHRGTAYLSGLTADDKSQDTYGQTRHILSKAEAILRAPASIRQRGSSPSCTAMIYLLPGS
jgi:enamine deaminase RidA (YjgF/YER057c/UK114 family)